MELEINGERTIESPSADDVAQAIVGLQNDTDHFIILSKDKMTYLQTARLPDGLILEYQVGSTAAHYGCYDPVQDELAVRVFTAYLDNTDEWKALVQWQVDPL